MTALTSKDESFSVGALRARLADTSMKWSRSHVEGLINQIAELTKQRDEGWKNFYVLRKRMAEERYPGMTGVVRAHETECFDSKAAAEFAQAVIQNVCELPDRNSPDDEPEALICSPDELESCIVREMEVRWERRSGRSVLAPAHSEAPADSALPQIINEMEEHAKLKRPGSLIAEWAARLRGCTRPAGETTAPPVDRDAIADAVGDFLYDHCVWRPTGDAQWSNLKANLPTLAALLSPMIGAVRATVTPAKPHIPGWCDTCIKPKHECDCALKAGAPHGS